MNHKTKINPTKAVKTQKNIPSSSSTSLFLGAYFLVVPWVMVRRNQCLKLCTSENNFILVFDHLTVSRIQSGNDFFSDFEGIDLWSSKFQYCYLRVQCHLSIDESYINFFLGKFKDTYFASVVLKCPDIIPFCKYIFFSSFLCTSQIPHFF